MTAPISNEPTTTRLHHYAGHYCMRGGIACEYVPIRPRRRPRAPQSGLVGQVRRLSETSIAFAGAGRASNETGIACARSCSSGIETVIAFAGVKWVFLARFSAALVLSVSMVAVQG